MSLSVQLRALRLARWWSTLGVLMKITWASVSPLGLVLVLVVFMSSVVGMELFQEDYKDLVCRIQSDCTLPRWHMVDFFHSVLVVFRVLWGEWIKCLWDCMQVSNRTTCVVFYVTVLLTGNLLVRPGSSLFLEGFQHEKLETWTLSKVFGSDLGPGWIWSVSALFQVFTVFWVRFQVLMLFLNLLLIPFCDEKLAAEGGKGTRILDRFRSLKGKPGSESESVCLCWFFLAAAGDV